MSSSPFASLLLHVSNLLHEAVYALQKEAVKAALLFAGAAAVQLIRRRTWRRAEATASRRASSPGDFSAEAALTRDALVAVLTVLLLLLVAERSLLRSYVAIGGTEPPPPPPGPLPLPELARRSAAFCKRHPREIAGVAITLVFLDWANLAIILDRADPILGALRLVTAPVFKGAKFFGKHAFPVGKHVWRLLTRHRENTLCWIAANAPRRP